SALPGILGKQGDHIHIHNPGTFKGNFKLGMRLCGVGFYYALVFFPIFIVWSNAGFADHFIVLVNKLKNYFGDAVIFWFRFKRKVVLIIFFDAHSTESFIY